MKKLLPVLLAVCLSACSKNSCDPPTGFVFGEAFGECVGDCARVYKISGEKMYEDNMINYNRLSFKDTPLPDSLYQVARHLADNIPDFLIDHDSGTLGCPDCADQGNVYIEFYLQGCMHRWKLDPDTQALPVEIRNYVSDVTHVMELLR